MAAADAATRRAVPRGVNAVCRSYTLGKPMNRLLDAAGLRDCGSNQT